jgi:prepilin-type N-terminal cleavage/methylation domain-containing protein
MIIQSVFPKSSGAQGFSLIESLITLSLFLFILLGAFQIFSATQNQFISLKQSQEIYTTACAALDKMTIDIQRSGQKLALPASLGLLSPISKVENILHTLSAEKCFPLEDSLFTGQTSIPISNTEEFKLGNEMCIFDKEKGEVLSVTFIEENRIQISPPLSNSYATEGTAIILLKKISFYLEEGGKILRRKVNSSPAQPLCEGVRAFDFAHDPFTNLVKVNLRLNPLPEKNHEILIFSKNAALAAER